MTVSRTPIRRDLTALFANRPLETQLRIVALDAADQDVADHAHLSRSERFVQMLDLRERLARFQHGTEPRFERVLVIARRT